MSSHLKTWRETAGAVEQALEILGNLCVADGGSDEKEEDSLPAYLIKLLQNSGVFNKVRVLQTAHFSPNRL